MDLVSILVSMAISLGMLILGLAVLASMRSRGYDPVAKIAGVITPEPAVGGGQ